MEIEIDGLKLKVIFKESKGKNIRLRAYDDYVLEISAPKNTRQKDIDSYLKITTDWISNFYKSRKNITCLIDYEKVFPVGYIYILGKKYDISFVDGEDRVWLDGDKIVVSSIYYHDRVFRKYYQKEAKTYMDKIIKSFQYFLDKEKQQMPAVAYKKMLTRWGSCNKQLNKLNLSYFLYQLDEELIEYVILHELCHLVHANHQKDYHDLLYKYMNDYSIRRESLRKDYSLPRG